MGRKTKIRTQMALSQTGCRLALVLLLNRLDLIILIIIIIIIIIIFYFLIYFVFIYLFYLFFYFFIVILIIVSNEIGEKGAGEDCLIFLQTSSSSS